MPKGFPKRAPGGRRERGGGLLGRGAGFLVNTGFAIQSWADIFARYYPSLAQTITVKAQGGPQASGNAVVHSALSVAFGCLKQRRLGSIDLHVAINHTENSAEIVFKISSLTLIDALERGAKLNFDNLFNPEETIPEIAGRILSAGILSADDLRKAAEILARWGRRQLFGNEDAAAEAEDKRLTNELKKKMDALESKVPGVVRPGGPGDADVGPPIDGDNTKGEEVDAKATLLVESMLNIYRNVSRSLGVSTIWNLGRTEIRGGSCPPTLLPKKNIGVGLVGLARKVTDGFTGLNTFNDLQGKTILTRQPAANPQMPIGRPGPSGYFGFGTDLRSLVAQVLHDPGVRPPTPMTDAGLSPVMSETLGV